MAQAWNWSAAAATRTRTKPQKNTRFSKLGRGPGASSRVFSSDAANTASSKERHADVGMTEADAKWANGPPGPTSSRSVPKEAPVLVAPSLGPLTRPAAAPAVPHATAAKSRGAARAPTEATARRRHRMAPRAGATNACPPSGRMANKSRCRQAEALAAASPTRWSSLRPLACGVEAASLGRSPEQRLPAGLGGGKGGASEGGHREAVHRPTAGRSSAESWRRAPSTAAAAAPFFGESGPRADARPLRPGVPPSLVLEPGASVCFPGDNVAG